MTSKLNVPMVQGTLQNQLEQTLIEMAHGVVAELLDKKLRAQRIKLTKSQLKAFAKRILAGELDFDDGKSEVAAITLTEHDTADLNRRLDELNEKVPALAKEFLQKTSAEVLKLLKSRWRSEAQQQRRTLQGFRKRLHQRWGPGIDKLSLLVAIARDFGSSLAHEPGELEAKPTTIDLLRRLHARACQITEEIIALLTHGFADGAMARWRTLHEIAATAYLIREHGEDLAERYIAHDIVETRRAALQYQRYAQRLGQEPLSKDELAE